MQFNCLLAQVTEPEFYMSAGRRLFPLALAAMEAALRRLADAPLAADWRVVVYKCAQQARSHPHVHELCAQTIAFHNCMPSRMCIAVTAQGPLDH